MSVETITPREAELEREVRLLRQVKWAARFVLRDFEAHVTDGVTGHIRASTYSRLKGVVSLSDEVTP